mmetsp:Transcript_8960/g.20004  ORF Transcript_8960/g.20004 Transcript_8960/m.20004 type:complete len:255 (+) Transcript_8960:75-839(+)
MGRGRMIDENMDVVIKGNLCRGQRVQTELPKAAENRGVTQEEWEQIAERLNVGLQANNCYRATCSTLCGTAMTKDEIVEDLNEEFLLPKRTRMIVHGARHLITFEHIHAEEKIKKRVRKADLPKWNNGLFSVCGGGATVCLQGTFCPCWLTGLTGNYLLPDHKYTMCCLYCALETICCHLKAVFMYDYPLRLQVAERKHIEESVAKRCCVTVCCTCCSRIQVWNEVVKLKEEEAEAADIAAGVAPPPQQQMATT